MSPRTLLEKGPRDCLTCGETKDRLSRHWSFCEFPTVDGPVRALLTGVLLGGGSLGGNGENTQHLLVQTTSERLARWLFAELDWLAHSLRRETYDGERDPIYHVRTHSHPYLRRCRDDWYRGGEKRIQADASLTATSARVWWALAGGIEWTGQYDSQVRGTFSAAADDRADAIASVLETAGYGSERLDRRVVLFGDDLRDWLGWTGEPVPGVAHKWTLERDIYETLREEPGAKLVTACPECDSTQIYERVGMDPAYRCSGCGHAFDTAVNRPPKSGGRREGDKLDVETRNAAIRDAAAEMGTPLKMEEYKKWQDENPSAPFYKTISDRWGWSAACDAAGVEPFERTPHREWPADEVCQALRDAATDLGDAFSSLTYREWTSGRDAPAVRVIYDRYDSWDDAVEDANAGE